MAFNVTAADPTEREAFLQALRDFTVAAGARGSGDPMTRLRDFLRDGFDTASESA